MDEDFLGDARVVEQALVQGVARLRRAAALAQRRQSPAEHEKVAARRVHIWSPAARRNDLAEELVHIIVGFLEIFVKVV